MTEQYSALVLPGNEMVSTMADSAYSAMAQLEAIITAGSEVAALLRFTTDEFGARDVRQIQLPLPPRDGPPSFTASQLAWLREHDRQVAQQAWVRGFSRAYWMSDGSFDVSSTRDDIPDGLDREILEEINPYLTPPDRLATADAVMAAEFTEKDRR